MSKYYYEIIIKHNCGCIEYIDFWIEGVLLDANDIIRAALRLDIISPLEAKNVTKAYAIKKYEYENFIK